MNANRVTDSLSRIDDDMIRSVEMLRRKNKRSAWMKWGATAACLCLVTVGIIAYLAGHFRQPQNTDQTADTLINDAAYGFSLSGDETTTYYPISFKERKEYGLLPEDAVGLTMENTYQITGKDLGELMGTVAYCGDEAMIGCKVYHFAQYPDKDSICIAETPTGYKFYVCSWLNVENEDADNSENVFSVYSLPESFEKMEVLSKDLTYLYTIEDAAIIERIFEILSGKSNIGHEANERRFAQVWYDTYGNNDVYYSESAGHCVFKSTPSDNELTIYTDGEGNTVMQNSAQDTSLYDKAQELWTAGERVIEITTTKGFKLSIDYFPAIGVFICANGYYELSDDDVVSLNQLLYITE